MLPMDKKRKEINQFCKALYQGVKSHEDIRKNLANGIEWVSSCIASQTEDIHELLKVQSIVNTEFAGWKGDFEFEEWGEAEREEWNKGIEELDVSFYSYNRDLKNSIETDLEIEKRLVGLFLRNEELAQ